MTNKEAATQYLEGILIPEALLEWKRFKRERLEIIFELCDRFDINSDEILKDLEKEIRKKVREFKRHTWLNSIDIKTEIV